MYVSPKLFTKFDFPVLLEQCFLSLQIVGRTWIRCHRKVVKLKTHSLDWKTHPPSTTLSHFVDIKSQKHASLLPRYFQHIQWIGNWFLWGQIESSLHCKKCPSPSPFFTIDFGNFYYAFSTWFSDLPNLTINYVNITTSRRFFCEFYWLRGRNHQNGEKKPGRFHPGKLPLT